MLKLLQSRPRAGALVIAALILAMSSRPVTSAGPGAHIPAIPAAVDRGNQEPPVDDGARQSPRDRDGLPGSDPVNGADDPPASERDDRAAARRGLSIDMQMVYGQYDNLYSTISLTQEQKDFVYRLSSNYKKSNDFGFGGEIYDNTNFFENRIGFTGAYTVSERWKLQLDASVENYSRGMFDNAVYRREEEDLVAVSLKSRYRFTDSFEAYARAGSTGFAHRLRPTPSSPDEGASSYLNLGSAETGGELVWSARNRIRYAAEYLYYNFHDRELDNRSIVSGEAVDDFNLTEHIGLSAGAAFAWSEYDDSIAGPVVGVTVKGFRYASLQLLYRYHLLPFRPERLYASQKFVYPLYDLPSGRVHHGEMKTELRIGESVNMKIGATADQNSNFYNFRPAAGGVLRAETMPAAQYGANCEANIFLLRRMIDIAFGYEYAHFVAERHVTYRPDHAFDGTLSYNGDWWKLQWGNRFIDPVYIDPDASGRLDRAIIGSVGVQFKLLESFYANLRVENLYNSRYNLRDGYPEPGMTVLGGVRIML